MTRMTEKVTVRRALLVNLGNFQNTTLEYSVDGVRGSEETLGEALERLDQEVVDYLSRKVAEVKKDFGL
jgi:hypothetical protein